MEPIITDEVKQDISKLYKTMRWWGLFAIFLDIVLLCVVLFYKPAIKIDDSAINFAVEQRQAIRSQRIALDKLSDEREKRDIDLAHNDSLLRDEIVTNRNIIRKTKNQRNEKIVSISHYNSPELVRAFAELER